MSLKQTIDQDLKQALLDGDKLKTDTLRVVKSVILNEEISKNKRQQGLSDEEIIICLKKEAKKRHEAAELYKKANSNERAEKELSEKQIIEAYSPETMTESEISALIEQAIAKHGVLTSQNMGLIIGEVKVASKNSADGFIIAKLVKNKLN